MGMGCLSLERNDVCDEEYNTMA
jgi:hypothetical protein